MSSSNFNSSYYLLLNPELEIDESIITVEQAYNNYQQQGQYQNLKYDLQVIPQNFNYIIYYNDCNVQNLFQDTSVIRSDVLQYLISKQQLQRLCYVHFVRKGIQIYSQNYKNLYIDVDPDFNYDVYALFYKDPEIMTYIDAFNDYVRRLRRNTARAQGIKDFLLSCSKNSNANFDQIEIKGSPIAYLSDQGLLYDSNSGVPANQTISTQRAIKEYVDYHSRQYTVTDVSTNQQYNTQYTNNKILNFQDKINNQINNLTLQLNNKVLIKDQKDHPEQNGLYTVTTLETQNSNLVLTRTVDFDTDYTINSGNQFFDSTNNKLYICTNMNSISYTKQDPLQFDDYYYKDFLTPQTVYQLYIQNGFTTTTGVFSNQVTIQQDQSQPPMIINSSNMVQNLNVQYLNSQPGSYYTNVSNINSGILSVQYGGTGISNINNGYVLFGYNSQQLNTTSNFYWDNINNRLGINNQSPQQDLDITGSVTISGDIYLQGDLIVGNGNGQTSSNTSTSANTQQQQNTQQISQFSSQNPLEVNSGGTGINYIEYGYIMIGNGVEPLFTTSNLFWNSGNNRLGINNSNPQYSQDIVGNLNVTEGIYINQQSLSADQGQIPFGTGQNQAYQSSQNLFWDQINQRLGIGNNDPNQSLDVIGNIQTSSNLIVSNQIVSLATQNISPLSIISSTLVQNLNVQYLGGQPSNYYTQYSNLSNVAVNVQQGGTGLSQVTHGQIIYGNGTNQLLSSSNLIYDTQNQNTKLSQLNITTQTQSPLIVSNSNLVSNLNVQYLQGQNSNYYTQFSNLSNVAVKVQQGGTGLNNISPGYIMFGSTNTQIGISQSLFWDQINLRLGIQNTSPNYAIDVIGSIQASCNFIASNQFVSLVSKGISPLQIMSTTLVQNLNVQYLNGQQGFYYTNASNIQSGILASSYGGTGLQNPAQGFILFGQLSNSLGQSSNLFWDSTNLRLGVNNSSPQQTLDVVGNITCSSNIYFQNQIVSLIMSGTPPLQITSTTLVQNLNVQYLDGQQGSYYTNASNISSGILGVVYGGTGLTLLSPGQLLFATGSNSFGQTSNVTYDQTNSNLKVNQLNINLASQNSSQAPFIVSNSNLVSNLNVQYLNSQQGSYYTNANNISAGILGVTYGGTGVSIMTTGYVHFGSGSVLGQSSNLFWNSSQNYLGIGTNNPSYTLHVQGTIYGSSNFILSNQFISTLTTGQSPLNIISTTMVSNLNVQYLDSQSGSFYTDATNISSGILSVTYGGTGLNQLQPSQLVFAITSNCFGQSSNIVYDQTNSNLKVNQMNVTLSPNSSQSPLIVSNSNLVLNLNSQYLNGQPASYYANTQNFQGTINVSQGGTGLTSLSQGCILFGQGTNQMGASSNLFWDSTNLRLGINNASPQQSIDVIGNIICSSNIYLSNQLVSLIASGTSPLQIASTTLVSNLNVQYLNGQQGYYYTMLSNQQGILSGLQGGTGLSNINQGQVVFGNTNNSLTQSSKFFWNNTSNYLGIGTQNPQYSIDVVGSVNVTQQLLINGMSVNAGLQVVQKGGTGLSNVQSGYILFGQDSNQLNTSSNLTFNNSNQQLVISSILINSNFNISTSSLVSNLNVQYLNSQQGSYYTMLSNQQGILSGLQGGTGLSNINQGQVLFGNISNSLTQTSKFFWNNTSNYLGIGTQNPQYSIDVVGSVNVTQSLLINGVSVNAGLQVVQKGGTGLSNVQSGYILFGQDSNQLNTSSDLTFNNNNQQLVISSILINSNFNISTSNLVSNLNAQYLGGQQQSYYTNATNIQSGVLSVYYGGTGLSQLCQSQLIFANTSNTFGQTSNIIYDQTNSNLKVSQINITLAQNSSQSPLIVSNSNLVSNLNAQYLNGQPASYYATVQYTIPVSQGGTGLSNILTGQIPLGSNQQSLTTTSNLYYDTTSNQLNTSKLNITLDSNSSQSPIIISNSNMISNLNAQYLGGMPASAFSTTQFSYVSNGGTGLSNVLNGYILFGSGSNQLNTVSNLIWDNTNNRLGINNSTPKQALDVTGSVNIQGNVQISGKLLVGNMSSSNNQSSNAACFGVQVGGTGVNSISQGCIMIGNGTSSVIATSNLFWDTINMKLGINNPSPNYTLDVIGSISASSNLITSNQIISLTATGVAPIQIASATLVSNLNVQYLNSQLGSYYTNASNISSGILATTYGGTGVSSITAGYVNFGSSTGTLGQSSNFFWQSTSNYLGIGTSNPVSNLHVVGSILVTQNVQSSNQFINSVAIGTAPFQITSTTLVSNLNVQYFNGQLGSYYTNASNIQSGILGVSFGGTGLSNSLQGYIPFGQGSNSLGQSSNLFWDSTNSRLGIRNNTPQHAIDVVGCITCSSNIYLSNQLVSTIATSTAPFQISSTALVSNLNVQYFNGQLGSYYTNASNIQSGILSTAYGGTGVSSITAGCVNFGSSTGTLGQSSNFFWQSTSNYLGIGTSNPVSNLHVVGSVLVTQNVQSSNQFINSVAIGTAPFQITSTTLVSNLNVQYFNGQLGSYYTNASNIQSGILGVTYGGTGLANSVQGYIPFGQGSNSLGQSSNLFWDSTNLRLGIRNNSPQHAIDVVGNITCSSNIYLSNQLVSSIATGISPFQITSTTLVSNLNVQYLNGQLGSYYTNASNIQSGILKVGYGGTGLSNFLQGYILFGQGSNSLGQSSNIIWDSTNLRLGINNQSPQQAIDVVGNITCSSNIYLSNQLVSSIAANTAPFQISSTALVSNLNVQYLNGQLGSYYTNANSIQSGILGVVYGGTGLNQLSPGQLLFALTSNSFGQSSNMIYDQTNSNLKINQINITLSSNSSQSPLIISNSNLVQNLNSQYLNGQPASYYTNIVNFQGIVNVSQGGTGLTSLQQGYIPFGQGTNSLGQSSNFFWNSTSNYLGINTSAPSNVLDVYGSSNGGCFTARAAYRQIQVVPYSNGGISEIIFNAQSNMGDLSYTSGIGLNTGNCGSCNLGFIASGKGIAMTLQSNTGNFGINTINPSATLDVNGAIQGEGPYNNIILNGTSNISEIKLNTINNCGWSIGPNTYGCGVNNFGFYSVYLSSNQAIPLSINGSNGQITMGNSLTQPSPTYGGLSVFTCYNSTYSNYGYLSQKGAGTYGGSYNYQTSIWGSGRIVANLEFEALSDRRLKDNIVSLDQQTQVNFVKQLKPVNFMWKDRTKSTKKQIGFIAQDIIRTGINYQELVNMNQNDKLEEEIDENDFVSLPNIEYSLHYDGFAPVLTSTTQYLLDKIEKQDELNSQLLLQIQSMQKSIKCLESKIDN